MRKAILALLLAVASSSAMAEWVSIARNDEQVAYFNPSTIHKDNKTPKMEVLLDFKTAQKLSGVKYLSIKGLQEYDCEAENARFLALQYLSGKMGKGNAIYKDSNPGDWYPVPPHSMTRTLWKVACRQF